MQSLVIRDFDRQAVISPEDVSKLVLTLPKHHYSGLRTIFYKPQFEMREYDLPIGQHCKGAYLEEYRAIVIFDLIDRAQSRHVILHEIGHYVFHQKLDATVRSKWTTKVRPNSPCISDYAKTNPAEDFAETYAFYSLSPNLTLRKTPAKHNFMKLHVFGK